MIYPLDLFMWQALRKLVRAKGAPLTGRELRVYPSRRTKDGRFLDAWVTAGFLIRLDTIPLEGRGPAQFRTYYAITAKGEYAAEYGECENDRTERAAILDWNKSFAPPAARAEA